MNACVRVEIFSSLPLSVLPLLSSPHSLSPFLFLSVYPSLPRIPLKTKKKWRKKKQRRTAGAARRFMTFITATYTRPEGVQRLKKKKKEGRKRKNTINPASNCIFIRGDIFTATPVQAREMRRDVLRGCTVRRAVRSEEEEEEESSARRGSDRRSSKLAAERYTSQTRIMLFYEGGIPTVYLPTYERPLSCGKLSRRLAEFAAAAHCSIPAH